MRVSGRQVEFLVPTEFLGGVPEPSWAYTVLVTGADIEQAGSPDTSGRDAAPMMTMGVARGVAGHSGASAATRTRRRRR